MSRFRFRRGEHPPHEGIANDLSAVRWSVAEIRKRMMRSTATAEATFER